MDEDERFAAMADACLKAYAAVAETGTPEMMALARLLLFQVGRETADRAGMIEQTSAAVTPIVTIKKTAIFIEIRSLDARI